MGPEWNWKKFNREGEMTRIHRTLVTVLCILFLAGCGTVGRNFNSENVKLIKKDDTTQSEILELFGTPYEEGTENGYVIWTYKLDHWYLLADSETKGLVIRFDEKNRVNGYRYTSNLIEDQR
ncbi:MAG: hypothetical protein COV67_08670 [Nitrospinae bacterium CG11_big_fil_rev_8_21_14_0_20_56_8]|nr:MAG: hypothetical protein COV67_08670 [Nitrospinae bacterium CG11_big_fil_rev_8_21_14_0_20_56_8]